jgi:hypothetical protein
MHIRGKGCHRAWPEPPPSHLASPRLGAACQAADADVRHAAVLMPVPMLMLVLMSGSTSGAPAAPPARPDPRPRPHGARTGYGGAAVAGGGAMAGGSGERASVRVIGCLLIGGRREGLWW